MEIKTPRCATSCVLRSNQSLKQTASLERQGQVLQSGNKDSLRQAKICGLLRAQQLASSFSFSPFFNLRNSQDFLVWCTAEYSCTKMDPLHHSEPSYHGTTCRIGES